MKTLTLLLAVTMTAAAARAQQAPATPPATGNTFQICMFPNPCGPNTPQPTPPPKKDEKKVSPKATVEAIPADPLMRAVIDGSLATGGDGIVSSIRLTKKQTGVPGEQIITHGRGLRDALAPARQSAGLPASVVPATKDGAKSAADDDWVQVDAKGAAAGQLNGMRGERKALQGDAETSTAAGRRMYKDEKQD